MVQESHWGPGGVQALSGTESAILNRGSGDADPEGLERHLDAARQKLPRDNFCRSIAAQLPSPRGHF